MLLFFVEKKCENLLHCKRFSHFFNKNTSVFENVVSIDLTNLRLNNVVRLTYTLNNWPQPVNCLTTLFQDKPHIELTRI